MIKYIKNNKLKVKIKSNSSENKILNYNKEKEILNINIKALPIKNKANIELIKFLSKLTKKKVKIKKGLKSKEKILEFI